MKTFYFLYATATTVSHKAPSLQILVYVFNTYILALLWHFWKQSSINCFLGESGERGRSRAAESRFEAKHALCVLVDSSVPSFL